MVLLFLFLKSAFGGFFLLVKSLCSLLQGYRTLILKILCFSLNNCFHFYILLPVCYLHCTGSSADEQNVS